MGTTNYSDLAADTLAVGPITQPATTVNVHLPQVLAAAGSTQLGAGAITGGRVVVTVTASTQGVRLPTAATGKEVRVTVPGTVGVKVYPALNAKLDASSTNTGVVLVAGKSTIYFARDATRWITLKGA